MYVSGFWYFHAKTPRGIVTIKPLHNKSPRFTFSLKAVSKQGLLIYSLKFNKKFCMKSPIYFPE